MFSIQVPDINDSLIEVELDDEIFFLHFSWNDTAQYWALSIENAYNDELVSCLPIYPQRRLIEPVRSAQLPQGDLIAIHKNNASNISRDDFIQGAAVFIYLGVDDEL